MDSWNGHLTLAVMFLVVGAGISALSGQLARGWRRHTEAPHDAGGPSQASSLWRLKWRDVPEARLRLAHMSLGLAVLAVGIYQLVVGLLAT